MSWNHRLWSWSKPTRSCAYQRNILACAMMCQHILQAQQTCWKTNTSFLVQIALADYSWPMYPRKFFSLFLSWLPIWLLLVNFELCNLSCHQNRGIQSAFYTKDYFTGTYLPVLPISWPVGFNLLCGRAGPFTLTFLPVLCLLTTRLHDLYCSHLFLKWHQRWVLTVREKGRLAAWQYSLLDFLCSLPQPESGLNISNAISGSQLVPQDSWDNKPSDKTWKNVLYHPAPRWGSLSPDIIQSMVF